MFAAADDARIAFAGFNLCKRGGLASSSVLRKSQLQREIESHALMSRDKESSVLLPVTLPT
jgi:hypothetical protein